MSTKIKILRIIPTLAPSSGGPAQHIQLITKYLSSQEIETTVISLDEPSDTFLTNLNFKVIAIGRPKSPWQYNKKLLDKLNEIVLEFDVIIQHGIWLYHGYAIKNVLKKTASRKKIPLIIYPHGMLDPYYQVEKRRWLKAIRNTIYYQIIEKDNLESANALLFTSEMELQSHEVSFGNISGPIKTNLGYTSRALDITEVQRTQNLLFLGRIDPKKGIEELLTAWSKFKTTTKNSYKLIIAGPGWESDYGNTLHKIITTNETLLSTTIQLGQQNQQQIQNLLNSVKASILWSKHENFAQTISESLSVGTPVLISRGVNICNEIETQHAGLVGNSDWMGAFQTITNFYALSETEYQNYSSNAKELYQKKFHPTLYAIRLKEFIKFLMEAKP